MATTDKKLANLFISRYPKTNYYMQTILVDISKYIKNVGKRSFFSGEDKGDKYIALFYKDFGNLLIWMANEFVFTQNIENEDDIFNVVDLLFKRYATIYPNWPREYACIEYLLEQKKIAILAIHSNIVSDILLGATEIRSREGCFEGGIKYSFDLLVFNYCDPFSVLKKFL